MNRVILFFAIVAAVSGQGHHQQGLATHNQQIQEHFRKEAEVLRLSGFQPAPQPQFNNFYSSGNPVVDYDHGLRVHQAQIQAVLAEERKLFPGGINDPAYQQGLQIHQRQIQDHLQRESGFAPQPQYYHAPGAPYVPGIEVHQQQLIEHQRKEQQHLVSQGK